MIYHKKLFKRLLDDVRYNYWPINLFPDEFAKFEPAFKWITIGLVCHSLLCITVTQLWMLFPYVEPPEGMRKMPILSWFPFDVNPSPIYEITYALIDFCGINVMFGIVGFDMLWGFLITHLCVQYQLIGSALRSINHDSIFGNQKSDEQNYKDLIFIIKHHLKLSRFEWVSRVLISGVPGLFY